MTFRFAITPAAAASEIRLLGPAGPVPVERWALEAPSALLPGVDLAQRLVAAESAIAVEDALVVDAAALAGLTRAEAAKLGLPPLAEAIARLSASGLFSKPDYRVALAWARPNGQPILGAKRLGPWLEIGGEIFRLPDALYAIAEAVDRLEAASANTEDRLTALADLREVLPAGARAGLAEASGLVAHIHIAIADAFSLDMGEEPGGGRLTPILHRAGTDSDAPLLPAGPRENFEQRFHAASAAPAVYALSGQWYVVPQPPLRRALAVVKRVNAAPAATRRAFLAHPRAFLREELGEDADEVAIERLFRETPAYANRVLGLGLWKPRVVPWVQVESVDWIGAGETRAAAGAKAQMGLTIDARRVPLEPSQARELAERIERAIGTGAEHVEFAAADGPVNIPATHETLAALARLESQGAPPPRPPSEKKEVEVLLIETNENELGVEEDIRPVRPAPAAEEPARLKTAMKSHQRDGLAWLQRAWTSGLPGVLLADDMGLGKTLQGLAFLAWLREGVEAGRIARAPFLVVAPTGLLENWRAEHDKHLSAPGLGVCLPAYGKSLKALKRPGANGAPGLDVASIAAADWVLTTYETLRDYDRDFGQIRFAAALFDEAQKIKTPGVRLTDAAKAMQCDFRVALTGTPVENRLADLWCIMDGVHPGLLEDLKSFSARYEQNLDAEKLAKLKATLERPIGGRPPVLKRRLKEDNLPDLPRASLRPLRREMPAEQREAYEAALAEARAAQTPGAVLAALQRLRSISLHPAPDAARADAAFIAASARWQGAIEALDAVATAGEKALIFLDDLDLQARLAGLLQRRYALKAPLALINGSVDGASRQARVDAFQRAPEGFGAMILSPRAGGVGLTLTRANHVVHLSRWWNPAVEDQCTGRVHRIGQAKPVFVHAPMAVLGAGRRAFDENLDALLERKRKLMRETLMPPDATVDGDRDELFRATVG